MPTAPKPIEVLPAVDLPNLAMVDTHAHIHFDAFRGQVDAVLHRATEAGVEQLITVGVSTADSRKAAELAATYGTVYASVGIHPHDAGEAVQGIGYLRELAGRRKVVAVGECGFDFFKSTTTPEEQELALRLQIELAQELGLPLIFHVREAFDRFFNVVQDYAGLRGVVHSFTAGPAEAERALTAGFMLAVNGIVTFNNPDLRLAVKEIPCDQLLLETDCPFLSPVPNRGKTNEPARVVDIARCVAELRGDSVDSIAAATTANARRLFGL